MRNLQIRQLALSELDIFFDFFSSVLLAEFAEYSARSKKYMLTSPRMWNKENFESILKNHTRILLGAFKNEELVGFLEAEYPFAGVSLAIWLMVDPKFRRKGIGKNLLKNWEERIVELGGHNLYLYADKRNKNFYEKMGFEMVGFHKKSWFGNDEFIFSKIIQEPKEENFLR